MSFPPNEKRGAAIFVAVVEDGAGDGAPDDAAGVEAWEGAGGTGAKDTDGFALSLTSSDLVAEKLNSGAADPVVEALAVETGVLEPLPETGGAEDGEGSIAFCVVCCCCCLAFSISSCLAFNAAASFTFCSVYIRLRGSYFRVPYPGEAEPLPPATNADRKPVRAGVMGEEKGELPVEVAEASLIRPFGLEVGEWRGEESVELRPTRSGSPDPLA